jgi:hypothetical protein
MMTKFDVFPEAALRLAEGRAVIPVAHQLLATDPFQVPAARDFVDLAPYEALIT